MSAPTIREATVTISPVTGTIGAAVTGVDLRRSLSEEEVATIRSALWAHSVLFFPEQHLSTEQHLAFGRQLGKTNPAHPAKGTGLTELPEIFVPVTRSYASAENATPRWHADHSYMPEPSSIAILRAIEVPEAGGDTQWASTAAAYERLSDPFKRLLEGLTAVHEPPPDWSRRLAEFGPGLWNDRPVTEFRPTEHPVVIVHPESGRRGLYVNYNHSGTTHLNGLTGPESRALLDFLLNHITSPAHVVRHRWSRGDVAVWDNLLTLHAPVADIGPDTHRLLHRLSLQGRRPAGVPATA